MKRHISGAAVVMLGLLAAGPAQADNWADSFSSSHPYARMGNIGDRVVRGQGRFANRSNLGAMSLESAEPRPAVRSRRASRRTSVGNERHASSTRKSRSTRQASIVGSGGASGVASYYWQPQRVASGGWFNPNAMTAAHKTLPFGTKVRVTNVNNGRSAVVTINDRGPYIAGRVIDLSRAAAGTVGMIGSGLARVRMEILSR